MARALKSEVTKLGRRRLAWSCAGLVLVLSAVQVLLGVIIPGAGPGTAALRALPGRAGLCFGSVESLGLLVSMCIGASVVGWEFHNRTWALLLVREPRRDLLWGAKIAVLVPVAFLISLASGVGGLLGLAIGAAAHGVGAEPGWVGPAIATWVGALGQSTGVLFAGAVAGAAFAALLRSTGAGVAAGLGWLWVINAALGAVLDQFSNGGSRFLFGDALNALGTLLGQAPAGASLPFLLAALVVSAYTLGFVVLGRAALRRWEFG